MKVYGYHKISLKKIGCDNCKVVFKKTRATNFWIVALQVTVILNPTLERNDEKQINF